MARVLCNINVISFHLQQQQQQTHTGKKQTVPCQYLGPKGYCQKAPCAYGNGESYGAHCPLLVAGFMCSTLTLGMMF